MKKLLAFFLVAGLMVLVAGTFVTSSAVPIVYTTEADFVAVLDTYYLEDFDAFTYGSYVMPSLDLGPVNGYSYTMSADQNLFSGNSNMSTVEAWVALEIVFTSPVTAVGGIFWPTDYWGGNLVGDMSLEIVTGGSTFTYNLDDFGSSSFIGFTSNVPFSSMSITEDDPLVGGTQPWITCMSVMSVNRSPNPPPCCFSAPA